MSNEENTELQTEEQAEQPAEQPTEDLVKPQADDINAAEDKVGNIVSQILQLKEKNPKVFFGAIGGIGLLLILVLSGGGKEATLISGPVIKNLAVGQKYVLKSANSYDPAATVRLVALPGAIAAYDDTEEADRNTPCQHIPQNTDVSVLELQDAYGTKNAFVKVQIESGECKGKDGWALAIDVQ
jgi:hypothetical protein